MGAHISGYSHKVKVTLVKRCLPDDQDQFPFLFAKQDQNIYSLNEVASIESLIFFGQV